MFTAKRCATEVFDERVDHNDYIVGKDPSVEADRERITDMLGTLCQSLNKAKAPDDQIQLVKDVQDAISKLEADDIRAISAEGLNGAGLACKLGVMWEYICHKVHPRQHDHAGRRLGYHER